MSTAADVKPGFYKISMLQPTEADIEDHLAFWYIHIEHDGTGKEHNYIGQRTHHFVLHGTALEAIVDAMNDPKLKVDYLGDVEVWDLFDPV